MTRKRSYEYAVKRRRKRLMALSRAYLADMVIFGADGDIEIGPARRNPAAKIAETLTHAPSAGESICAHGRPRGYMCPHCHRPPTGDNDPEVAK